MFCTITTKYDMTLVKDSYAQGPLKTQMIVALLKIAKEEEKRAIDKFKEIYGRPYDGSRDEDWDLLDKTYTNLYAAVNLLNKVI